MRRAPTLATAAPAPARDVPAYPLQKRAILWGLVAGGPLVFVAPVAALAVFALFTVVGLLWRRDEPPVLAFCLAFQWLFMVSGYLYLLAFGYHPGGDHPGDLEGAVLWSVVGYLATACGVRIAIALSSRVMTPGTASLRAGSYEYDLPRLLAATIVAHVVTVIARPVGPGGGGLAGFISHAISFRSVLLALLFIVVVRRRRGYLALAVATAIAVATESTSQFSGWSWPLLVLLLILAWAWRPWVKTGGDRARTRITVLLGVLAIVLFFMALAWQGGVKGAWRSELSKLEPDSPVTDRLSLLGSIVVDVVPALDWDFALESLAQRLGAAYFFSLVLDRVPRDVPHEGGALTLRAVDHLLRPRFVFPDKPALGSNSWMVNRYAGLNAAGDEAGTSIAIGIAAQFYVDFGIPGMFAALALWGAIIGLAYVFLMSRCPSRDFAAAVVTVAIPGQFSTEGELAYNLAGLAQVVIVYLPILWLLGPGLHRWLSSRTRGDAPVGSRLPDPVPARVSVVR